jgi:WD40 repeat protein
MALGRQPILSLLVAPDPAAQTLATVKGSQVLWVEGRTADGRWLLVTYSDAGAQAWVAQEGIKLLGDADSLAIVPPDAVTAAPARGVGRELLARTLVPQLNVRSGAGLDQPIIGQLTAGATIAVVGRTAEGDWFAIRWPVSAPVGISWVAASLVEITGPAADLPILGQQTTAAVPPVPPLTGKIAFQTRIGGEIYLVNADGSDLRRVATGMDPALSPDSTRLAYARWDTTPGVFVLDLRTGQEQRIASAKRPRAPTWNSAGTQLVFSHTTREYVCLVTPFGCIEESIIRQFFGGNECIDTPRGPICIGDFRSRSEEETGLVQVTLADTAWLDLLSGRLAQSPSWRPGSAEVIFRDKQGIQVYEAGREVRSLVGDAKIGSPAWSPDGQRIAVQLYLHDHTDIFLLDAGGQTQKRLTAPASSLQRASNNVAPVWSPDGRYLLFLSDRDGAWRLYRMNDDGSDQVLLLPDVLGQLSLSYDFAAERVASWGR